MSVTYNSNAQAPTNAGSYAVEATLNNANYQGNATGTLVIDKAQLSVNANDQSTVYGDDNLPPSYELSGFVNNETSTSAGVSGAADCSITTLASDAGVYNDAIVCGPGNLDAQNYSFVAGSKGDLTITARPITVTADADQGKTYGDPDPALTYKITSGDLAGNDSLSGALIRAAGEDVGTYAIQQGSLSAGNNYDLKFVGANFTIGKADLTVKADNKSKTYGDANPDFTGTLTGVKNNDAIAASYSTTATQQSGVGTYPIVADVNATQAVLDNYSVTKTNGELSITKADLTVTADNKSKTYGDANPNFTASYSGFKNSDAPSNLSGTLAFDTQATAASAVGSYDVTPKGLTSGNYNINFVKGTLTVNKADLTVKADDKSKIVGAANPTFTGTLTGVKNNDAITASYSTTATQQSPVGTYPIVPSLNDPNNKLSNYNVNKTNGTLTIIYNFTVASGAGFLQPINYTSHQLSTGPDVSTFKAGSTVPVKFVLKDANGNVVQAASPPQWLTPTKGGPTTQPVDESLYSDPATTGTTYQWTGSQYHYNWASPKNGSGFFWRIGVKLDDGQIYYVNISLR